MRKILLISILTLIILAFYAVGITYATFPPHGEAGDLAGPFFAAETENCAGCHRAHTAVGTRLAFAKASSDQVGGAVSDLTTPSAFCLVCHGTNNNLADTNVVQGIYTNRNTLNPGGQGTVGNDLNAGGFVSLGGALPPTGSGRATKSKHVLETSGQTIWGGGTAGDDDTGNIMTLSCGSCHDPHGTPNYRLLISSEAGTRAGSRESGYGGSGYNPNYTATLYGKGKWVDDPDPATGHLEADITAGASSTCWKCHAKYKNTSDGSTPQGAYKTRINPADAMTSAERYRHPVNVSLASYLAKFPTKPALSTTLPLDKLSDSEVAQDSWVACLTCHYAHGTDKIVSGPSSVGAAGGSVLLRKNNRGVCEDCHNK